MRGTTFVSFSTLLEDCACGDNCGSNDCKYIHTMFFHLLQYWWDYGKKTCSTAYIYVCIVVIVYMKDNIHHSDLSTCI